MHAFAETLIVEQVPDPHVSPDGVLMEERATGLCGSDWPGWMALTPRSRAGHELAGVVAAVGAQVRGVQTA
jgi:alcohol dehydrogenase